jgi:small-conductance mechanosensitive channel
MRSRLAGIGRLRAALAAAMLLALAAAGHAQAPAQTPTPAPASVEAIKATLDAVEQALRSGADTDDSLAELKGRVAAVRTELAETIEALEAKRAEAAARLQQLGPPPAAATPEEPDVAAERARIARQQAELQSSLKEARRLADKADDLSARLTERRRALFTRELFERSAGLFDPGLWKDVADAVPAEIAGVGQLLRFWWVFARDNGGRAGWLGAALVLTGLAGAAVLLVRWWRRRFVDPSAASRFARARAALVVLARHAVAMPSAVVAVVLVLDSHRLLPAAIREIGLGFAAAVALASFGRAVAAALFAPDQPARRLIPWSDAAAARLAGHLTWSARILAVAIVLNVLHKATGAPVALTIATSALLALTVGALAIHLLWRTASDAGEADGPSLPGIRILLWLFVAAIAVTLAAGYIALAAFLAGRLVVVLAMAGALVVLDAFIDALLTEVLAGEGERGRRIAALLGLSQRGLDLVATLMSALIRLVLLVLAIFAVIGPWGMFADDVFGAIAEAAFGGRIAGLTVSMETLLGALALLLVGVLATRGAQRWLELRLLPRTGLDPGLQHSISTLFGYAALIAVFSLVLGAVGIDLQKVALIAGALSVGIGFGLQSVVSNFVSGLILLAERPIRVGDWVVVKNEEGFVRRISVRATEIETFDRASVIIPNSEFITGVVKNWTHANTLGRITIKVRAAYDSDVDAVREILLACGNGHPLVLKTPPPRVYLLAFGDIALEFELRCILANVEHALTVKSDLHTAVLQRFRAAGIKMAWNPHEERVPGGPNAAESAEKSGENA